MQTHVPETSARVYRVLVQLPLFRFVACGLCILSMSSQSVFAQSEASVTDPEGQLTAAINEYSAALELEDRNSRLAAFSRAEQLFRQVVASMRESGKLPNAELLTNLGNAAFQADHLGIAIVAYRRALVANPGHRQATQNLAFTRSTLPDWAKRSTEYALVDTLFFWQRMFSRGQLTVLMGLLFLLSAILISVGIIVGMPILRNAAAVPLLIWAVLFASTFVGSDAIGDEAIIVVDSTTLHSADSENSPLRLAEPLPNGTEVSILQERSRWSEVKLSGRTGWVRKSALERILLNDKK